MAALDLEALRLDELPTWLKGHAGEAPGAVQKAAEGALVALRENGSRTPLQLPSMGSAEALGREVSRELPRLSDAVAEHGAEGVAGFLETLGPIGIRVAGNTRQDMQALTVERVLRRLAAVLWLDRVGPRLEKEAIRRHPGIPLPLVGSARVGIWGRPRAVDAPEHGRVLVDGAGTTLATLKLDRIPAVSPELLPNLEAWERNGARLLGSLHAHRLIRWLAWEAHTRPHFGQAPIIEVVGGWDALATAVGARSNKAADKLRDIVWCLDAHHFTFPDGSLGRLLMVDRYRPSRGPGRQSRISLLPGAPLRPGYLFDLRRPARKIVPVLSELPPMVGRERDHGSVAELHWRVLVEMRCRCREMVGEVEGEDLGLPLPPAKWDALGDLARVPSRTLGAVLERWTRDGRDGPAFLSRVDGDRFTLGSAHEHARRVLLHYGWKEAEGSRAGLASARKRGNRGPTRRRWKQR